MPDGSLTRYVYGIGLLYEVDESDAPTYYHFDQSGSTIALTDSIGDVTDRVEYSPFGTTTHRTGTTDTPYLYAGQFGIQAESNGLFYMRARYYSPELQRFLNQDPIGFAGGMNWYAYAAGNPLMYGDPSGLYPGEFIVDYWADAIVNPSNGTLGGSIVSGIEGAGEGASAYFDGFVPVLDPFEGNYDADSALYATINDGAALTREGVIAVGGGIFARSVVASGGQKAVDAYKSMGVIRQTLTNRLILSRAFAAEGTLGNIQSGGSLILQGVGLYDGYQNFTEPKFGSWLRLGFFSTESTATNFK